MGDAENTLPPSKKRAAGREITKDNPGLDDEGDSSEETGTFKKASDEVLATRRIVKVRRNQSSTTTSSNPFAGIRLVAPPEPPSTLPAAEKAQEEKKIDATGETANSKDETDKSAEVKIEEPVADTPVEKAVNGDNKEGNLGAEATESKAVEENEKTVENKEAESKKEEESDKVETETKKDNANAVSNRMNSFQQLSSTQNAFTGLAGTGFSTATFSFGSGSTNFGLSTNGSSAVFNTTGPSIVSKNEGTVFPSKQDVPVETGEENEQAVFTADSVLFEYINGVWKERGKGELKVNVSTSGPERARLLMRSRGNYRLILNASLYPDMKLANMDKRGITFACINSVSEEKDGLSTFALKFKDGAIVEEFRAAVNAHKDKPTTTTALKTPENSPKASEE